MVKGLKMNIAVLMSTYNGEKYLTDQITSIFEQKDLNKSIHITLFIRDDGSSDHTVSIIEQLSKKYRIILLKDNLNNIGYVNSFFELIKSITADYYFLSDQDDIWGSKKVITHLNCYQESSCNEPTLIYTDLIKFGEATGTFFKDAGMDKRIFEDFRKVIFEPRLNGCLMSFNKEMRDVIASALKLIDSRKHISGHDTFIVRIAAFSGKVKFAQGTSSTHDIMNYRVAGQNISAKKRNRLRALLDNCRWYSEHIDFATMMLTNQKLLSLDPDKIDFLYQLQEINETKFFLKRFFKGLSLIRYQKNTTYKAVWIIWLLWKPQSKSL